MSISMAQNSIQSRCAVVD